jgi:hypothetical protein
VFILGKFFRLVQYMQLSPEPIKWRKGKERVSERERERERKRERKESRRREVKKT